eukprot:SAG11_NODE_6532_length_1294_cov_10.691792_2_plen_241_part_00
MFTLPKDLVDDIQVIVPATEDEPAAEPERDNAYELSDLPEDPSITIKARRLRIMGEEVGEDVDYPPTPPGTEWIRIQFLYQEYSHSLHLPTGILYDIENDRVASMRPKSPNDLSRKGIRGPYNPEDFIWDEGRSFDEAPDYLGRPIPKPPAEPEEPAAEPEEPADEREQSSQESQPDLCGVCSARLPNDSFYRDYCLGCNIDMCDPDCIGGRCSDCSNAFCPTCAEVKTLCGECDIDEDD